MLASNRIDFPPSHCFCHPFSRRYQTQLEPSGELDPLACVQGTDASGSTNTGSSMGTGDTRTGAACVITTASCMMGCLSEKPARVRCSRNAEILRRSHSRRMPAHPCNMPCRHPNPLRHPFKDWRDAPRIEGSSDQIPSDQPMKDGSFPNLRVLDPTPEPIGVAYESLRTYRPRRSSANGSSSR